MEPARRPGELRGDAEESRALHEEAFHASREHGSRRGMVAALEGLAGALSLSGSYREAARLFGVASAVRSAEAMLVTAAENGDLERIESRIRDALGPDGFAAELDRAAGMSIDEAFALLP